MKSFIIGFILFALTFAFWDESLENIKKKKKNLYDNSIEKINYCPKHEMWYQCGNACEPSCEKPKYISRKKCKRSCIPHSCRCKKGYYRDISGKGNCIRWRKCLQ